MREIKFRAYDEEANVMVYSDEHNLIDYSYEYFFEVLKDKVICVFLVDYDDSFGAPSTDRCELEKVMQYTGLHDKNGKEIYEGDIVKFDDEVWSSSYTSCGTEYDSCEVVNYGVVGFDEETLRYDFVKYKYNENQVEADLHENHDLEFADFIQEHEIIGNIYENPEVLEMEGENE